MTSSKIMSKHVPSSSHRPFHHNNNLNVNATSTLSSSNTSRESSISLPKQTETQTLSSAHNRKSCSLEKSIPISNCDPPPCLAGIQLPSRSAKSAKIQGKLAQIADKDPIPMPKQTRSGRQVLRPKRYED